MLNVLDVSTSFFNEKMKDNTWKIRLAQTGKLLHIKLFSLKWQQFRICACERKCNSRVMDLKDILTEYTNEYSKLFGSTRIIS